MRRADAQGVERPAGVAIKEAGKGLQADPHPVPPWEWRKSKNIVR
jgi:hypothetical protein